MNKNTKKKVFLGGTCNESTWRDPMQVYLYAEGVDYFNPVVDDWTEDCMRREIQERQNCDFCLYTITPKMVGVYSVAEVVDGSNNQPEKTVLVLLKNDGKDCFSKAQWKSLNAVARLVRTNGGQTFKDLMLAAVWIGEQSRLKIKS